MTVTQPEQLEQLREIGRIVATTLQAMHRAIEPGMTTGELDQIGAELLDRAGAIPAPRAVYGFPGTTCISVNDEIAHGIPSARQIHPGDLINIDVSASKDGYFADTGASFCVGAAHPQLVALCRDGHQAMTVGIRHAVGGKPLAGIGAAIGRYASKRGYTLIRNLASHGIGRSLHEDPKEIPTWPDAQENRRIRKGQVMTVEPFLSTGGEWASQGSDGWTLYAEPSAPCVQFEHTVVATERGPIILTLPSAA